MNFVQKIFETNEKKLSKVDYWKKWEFYQLLDDLHIAFKLLTGFKSDSSTTKDFKIALENKIDDIEFGNQTDLSDIWNWFSPGGLWEQTIGQDSKELKDRIFERTDRWKKASR